MVCLLVKAIEKYEKSTLVPFSYEV